MIEFLETLDALEKHGTMSKAATFLRISQSAVSKRIATLENQLDKKLVEKDGRNVSLTLEAVGLLNRVRPLLMELKHTISSDHLGRATTIQMGVSESILSSWGAKSLGKMKKTFPDINLVPHAHRSPVVIDRVRSGEYMLGICAGICAKAPDLQIETIGEEEFVLIQDNKENRNEQKELMTIEESSETWQAISRQVKGLGLKPTKRLESFFAIAQMANFGFVDGLVPKGVANYLAIPKSKITPIDIRRPIIVIGRKSTFSRENFSEFYLELKSSILKEL